MSKAEKLVALLDEALTNGEWQHIRMFSVPHASGNPEIVVSMGKSPAHYTVDLKGAHAKPSEKLLWLLEHNLTNNDENDEADSPVAENPDFEDLF